ncbi:MAG: hypothetical protein II719_06920 [Clostridia bacterium]|nr:hypothetical protein [Clostridia bacterium]
MRERVFEPESFLRAGSILASQIARRQSTIDWLRSSFGGPCGSDPERLRSTPGRQNGGEGERVIRCLELENRQLRDLERLEQVGRAIQKELEKIRDPQILRIVVLRCFEELSWPKIADRVRTDPRTAQRRYQKYLSGIQAPDLPDCEELYFRWKETAGKG